MGSIAALNTYVQQYNPAYISVIADFQALSHPLQFLVLLTCTFSAWALQSVGRGNPNLMIRICSESCS